MLASVSSRIYFLELSGPLPISLEVCIPKEFIFLEARCVLAISLTWPWATGGVLVALGRVAAVETQALVPSPSA